MLASEDDRASNLAQVKSVCKQRMIETGEDRKGVIKAHLTSPYVGTNIGDLVNAVFDEAKAEAITERAQNPAATAHPAPVQPAPAQAAAAAAPPAALDVHCLSHDDGLLS